MSQKPHEPHLHVTQYACTRCMYKISKFANDQGPRAPVWPKTWRSEPHAATLQTTIGTAAATLSRPKEICSMYYLSLFVPFCIFDSPEWLARQFVAVCASFNSIAAPWLEIRCYDAMLFSSMETYLFLVKVVKSLCFLSLIENETEGTQNCAEVFP